MNPRTFIKILSLAVASLGIWIAIVAAALLIATADPLYFWALVAACCGVLLIVALAYLSNGD